MTRSLSLAFSPRFICLTLALLAALGFGGHAAAVVAVPLSAAWLLNALWLGRAQARRQDTAQQEAAQLAAQADDNPAPSPPRPA